MRFKINKNDDNFVDVLFNTITINSIDDIFIGSGKILKASQEWEKLYKDFWESDTNEEKIKNSSTII